MTRINAGIPPSTLCDQHLIAEYRELPRMVAFAHKRQDAPDVPFTLNRGHMVSCVRYGAYLADRHACIIHEMKRRGFNPAIPSVQAADFPEACRHRPSIAWLEEAAEIVGGRIRERLAGMKRRPRFTR
jgi:hypothetical protein